MMKTRVLRHCASSHLAPAKAADQEAWVRIIVLGYIVRGPLGGMVWHHLQYVLGLRRLGHDVYFIEDSDDYESCYDPVAGIMTPDPSFGLKFTRDIFERTGLDQRWAFFDAHRNLWFGLPGPKARELLRSADVLLNISGVNPLRDWSLRVPHRAYIDTDPVFTQVRHLQDKQKMRDALAHTAFFTFGENIGAGGCDIPNDGLPWAPTRQPVVLDTWPASPGNPNANFTTVMQWDSYSPVAFDGRTFGMKSASFGPYLDLPRRTGERLELAIGSKSAPRDRLRDHGWIITDPLSVTLTPLKYQNFVRGSKAEFSVAKHGYQSSRSGWFSERSAAYLASARPVVAQDTGFTRWLKAEGGVLPFDSPESAVDAIQRATCDYARHCRKARAIAEEFFESSMVLDQLLKGATGTA
jgi:hypothetical protein